MGLQLNVSNSLEDLANQLAGAFMSPAGDVFQKQYLVTQTEGMNNWLTLQLAGKTGISANCVFQKPNDMVNQLYYWLGGDNRQVLGADHLQWLIYNILDEAGFRDQYHNIAIYYHGEDVKRIALAEKIADLFDQYQVYRPELVIEWNGSRMGEGHIDDWQKYIWMRVKENTGKELTDKTTVIQFIISEMSQKSQQERLLSRIPQMHVFGVSIITRLHIDLFNALSNYISVNFYLLNPAPLVYWLDDRTEKQIARMGQLQKLPGKHIDRVESAGNSLLISWGRVIQETFGLLFENDDFLNVYNDSGVTGPGDEASGSLLKKIQVDIFYNNDADSRCRLTESDLQDESLTINACYTPVREVEVLYNYLVHLVDQKKELLSPREIVVMVSDIDAYAPFIKAVFNTAPYRFPFTIADESYRSGDTLFTAIEAILSLSAESFKAEEVMQLLDSRYIRERFSITNTFLIRKAVTRANIRFGMRGNTADDTVLVSWNLGLQRIMYGICMSGSYPYSVNGQVIYPLDMVEGADALELIRFGHFIDVLKWYVLDRANSRSLSEWGDYVIRLVENLVYQSGVYETEDDYQRLLEHIEKLHELTQTYDEVVSYEVFAHSFLSILSSQTRSGAFAAGGITFCSLIPMRSIPFKVVALLGMDFDKFPRKETPVSFNLIEKKRKKGDRNVKDNDKHLFLETILSARKYLYISYMGRNAKDNSILPPSALVDELVDYIETGVAEATFSVRDNFIKTHPLHGFSQKYFQQDPGLYSYLGDIALRYSNSPQTLVAREPKSFDWTEIPAKSLLSFFRNPIKWYYNKVLGIYYNRENVLLPDTELFELEHLQLWQMRNELLYLDDSQIHTYRQRALETGLIPLKNMSEIVISNIQEEIAPVKQLLMDCTGGHTMEERTINIEIDHSVITGKLENIYGDKQLLICFSKNITKYLLEAYIKYLLITVQGEILDLVFLSGSGKKLYTIPGKAITKSAAREALSQMLSMFKKGHQEIFLFYPGFTVSPFKIAGLDATKFHKMAEDYLERNPDEYLQVELNNGLFRSSANLEQFSYNTTIIFSEVEKLLPGLLKS